MSTAIDEVNNIFDSLKEDYGYYSLKEKTNQTQAHIVIEKCNSKKSCRFLYSDGLLQILRINSSIHELTAHFILEQVKIIGTGHITGACVCNIKDRILQPDQSFRPYGRKTNGPFRDTCNREFPTLVIEVVLGAESHSDLKKKLELWISEATTVNIAIGVKIDRHVGKDQPCSLSLFMLERGQQNMEERNLQLVTENESIQISTDQLYANSPVMRLEQKLDLNLLTLKNGLDRIMLEEAIN